MSEGYGAVVRLSALDRKSSISLWAVAMVVVTLLDDLSKSLGNVGRRGGYWPLRRSMKVFSVQLVNSTVHRSPIRLDRSNHRTPVVMRDVR